MPAAIGLAVLVGGVAVAAATMRKPAPHPQALVGASVAYRSCAAARAAGAAPLRRGQPGYNVRLDSDRDGVACE